MRIFLLFPIVLLLCSCSNEHKVTSEIDIIDVGKAFENLQEVKLSKFVDKVTYIPLESKGESYISDYPLAKVEDYIIVRNSGLNHTPLLLFDKSNGKFIRYIGKIGRGPGEYSVPVKDFYNVFNKLIYTTDNTLREIKVLNINGEFLESFRVPEWKELSTKSGNNYAKLEGYLNGDTYVCYTDNFNGSIKSKLVIFNKDSVLKIFTNFLSWGDKDVTKNHKPSFNLTNFFRWNNKLYFKEMFNDTLFYVTIDKLMPRFIFNYGKYGLPYEQQDKFVNISPNRPLSFNYFGIKDMDENPDFLFFQLGYKTKSYTCIYDKKAKTTIVCKPVGDSPSALIDDINGFMPIVPQDINTENEMISLLNPSDILKWLKDNPEKSKRFGKNMDWLKTISETSNPVIVIGKCKINK